MHTGTTCITICILVLDECSRSSVYTDSQTMSGLKRATSFADKCNDLLILALPFLYVISVPVAHLECTVHANAKLYVCMTHISTHFPPGTYLFVPTETLNSCNNNTNNTSSSAFPAVGGVHVARLAYRGIFTIRSETTQEICPTMCHSQEIRISKLFQTLTCQGSNVKVGLLTI